MFCLRIYKLPEVKFLPNPNVCILNIDPSWNTHSQPACSLTRFIFHRTLTNVYTNTPTHVHTHRHTKNTHVHTLDDLRADRIRHASHNAPASPHALHLCYFNPSFVYCVCVCVCVCVRVRVRVRVCVHSDSLDMSACVFVLVLRWSVTEAVTYDFVNHNNNLLQCSSFTRPSARPHLAF
jgi:hypothetical protein